MKFVVRATAVIFAAAILVLFAFAAHYTYVELFNPTRAADAAPAPIAAPLSIREAETAIVSAAEAVMPAVVSVETKQTVRIPGFRGDPFFKHFFGEDFFGGREDREGVSQGLGSGVIVDSRGYILTNNHVVKGAEEILVRLDDGRNLTAKVLGTDERLDVAVLKIEGEGVFPTAPLGNSDDLRVGMFVLAIGTPFNRNLSQTVTMGIVSALSRSGLGLEELENFIQTDAAINMGNSGGPLVNLRGEVVGINVAIVTGGAASSAGVGFAIPINSARHSFQSIVSLGHVVHGYLGVGIQNIDDELRQSLDLETSRGALVTEVVSGGPADRAGIKRGDVITEWQGRSVRTAASLTDAVSRTPIGEKAELKYIRDGKEYKATATVAERPADIDRPRVAPDEPKEFKKLGMTLKWVEGRDAKRLDLPTEGVVVVSSVEEGSDAYRRGFRAGMGILEVNGESVDSVEDLEEMLSDPGRYRILVRYRGSNVFIALTL